MDISTAFSGLVETIAHALPGSPFRGFIDQLAGLPWLGWLNWFFPVNECLAVLAAWLAAYVLYLLYSVVMRWVKLIGG